MFNQVVESPRKSGRMAVWGNRQTAVWWYQWCSVCVPWMTMWY